MDVLMFASIVRADPPSATPDQLAALDAILARAEFQAALGWSLIADLIERFQAWLWSWAVWLLEPLRRLLGQGPEIDGAVLTYGVLALAVVVVLVALVLIVRLMRGRVTGEDALADAAEAGPPRAADELARARTFASDGSPRQAVHHHYLAVLLRLDERDHLRFDGTLTNRELLPRLTAAPELADPFEALVARFDRLWYGQTSCTTEEYAAFAAVADRVWHAAGAVQASRTPATLAGSAPPRALGGLP